MFIVISMFEWKLGSRNSKLYGLFKTEEQANKFGKYMEKVFRGRFKWRDGVYENGYKTPYLNAWYVLPVTLMCDARYVREKKVCANISEQVNNWKEVLENPEIKITLEYGRFLFDSNIHYVKAKLFDDFEEGDNFYHIGTNIMKYDKKTTPVYSVTPVVMPGEKLSWYGFYDTSSPHSVVKAATPEEALEVFYARSA